MPSRDTIAYGIAFCGERMFSKISFATERVLHCVAPRSVAKLIFINIRSPQTAKQ